MDAQRAFMELLRDVRLAVVNDDGKIEREEQRREIARRAKKEEGKVDFEIGT